MKVQFKKGPAAEVKAYALAHPDCMYKVDVYFNNNDGSLILALPDSSTLGSEEVGYTDFHDYIRSQLNFDFKISI